MSEQATHQFTREELSMLHQLVRSPGWRVLVEKVLLPRIQQTTEMLDRPNSDQNGHGDFLRGQKRAMLQLLDCAYFAGGLRNPIQDHQLALLRRLADDTPLPDIAPQEKDTDRPRDTAPRYAQGFPV